MQIVDLVLLLSLLLPSTAAAGGRGGVCACVCVCVKEQDVRFVLMEDCNCVLKKNIF